MRASRLARLQLSNEEATLRMQRYLRQPLSVLAGIVGKCGQDVKRTIIDCHGDGLLSSYKAPNDSEHITLHNALCGLLSTCASQAHVSNVREGGKVTGYVDVVSERAYRYRKGQASEVIALPADVNREELVIDVLDEAIGLGPLERLLEDPTVGEIMVNAADEIWVERHGRLHRHPAAFSDDDAVQIGRAHV